MFNHNNIELRGINKDYIKSDNKMASINNLDDVLLISDDDSGDEMKVEPAPVDSLNATQAGEPEGRRISRRKKAKVN